MRRPIIVALDELPLHCDRNQVRTEVESRSRCKSYPLIILSVTKVAGNGLAVFEAEVHGSAGCPADNEADGLL